MSNIPDRLGIPEHEFRLIFGRTKIDYDRNKEECNRKKHGYSLESAAQLFERMLLPTRTAPPFCISDGFMEKGEVRHIHMSVDDSGKVIVMVTTMRPDETVRIISYRRASTEERDFYCQNTGYQELSA